MTSRRGLQEKYKKRRRSSVEEKKVLYEAMGSNLNLGSLVWIPTHKRARFYLRLFGSRDEVQ